MTKTATEMNEAIDNFCIRMAKTEKKTIEDCTADEYFDYLENFCDFCSEEI